MTAQANPLVAGNVIAPVQRASYVTITANCIILDHH
jgi:hypothetical protein